MIGEHKNILEELGQNSSAGRMYSDKQSELEVQFAKKLENLEGQLRGQQAKVEERKKQVEAEMGRYRRIIERREECEKELQEVNGRIKETNKNIKLLEEAEIDLGFDLKAQIGKIRFMEEQIRDIEHRRYI